MGFYIIHKILQQSLIHKYVLNYISVQNWAETQLGRGGGGGGGA